MSFFTFFNLEIDVNYAPIEPGLDVIGELGRGAVQPLLAPELVVELLDLGDLVEHLVVVEGAHPLAAAVVLQEGLLQPETELLVVHGLVVYREVRDPGHHAVNPLAAELLLVRVQVLLDDASVDVDQHRAVVEATFA